MNAQEAIEIKERELDVLKADLQMWRTMSHLDEEAIDRYERSVKAESILLESAKLFHKHTIPMLESRHKELGMDYNSKTVFRVPLENVGIEEGAKV
ncbi:MAG: hypothetical protein JJU16_05285 [Alkalibacterium sp.]|nr:hypothetical protein [Alkalibacterium sp.]